MQGTVGHVERVGVHARPPLEQVAAYPAKDAADENDERQPGVAVAEGVHSLQEGNVRNVNALTSQRLTDAGAGSTFYDNRVEVRAG